MTPPSPVTPLENTLRLLRLLVYFPSLQVVDVVFYRGITMQRAVERDSANRSSYVVCAMNPSKISPSTDSALREVVYDISRKTNYVLEIVNFNVEVCYPCLCLGCGCLSSSWSQGQQYVCASELVTLQTTTDVPNYLKSRRLTSPK